MNAIAESLHRKSFDFAVRMVKLARYLPEEGKNKILATQILRSGTSIGANIREASFAQSKADFISKLSIALKEASETQYWLDLLLAAEMLTTAQHVSLKTDLDILVGILVKVVKSSKRNGSKAPSCC